MFPSQILAPNLPLETLSAITTDSRRITPGCLFVAVKGDLHDGHRFIPQAIAQGAVAVLCKKGTRSAHTPEQLGNATLVEVDDTITAFREMAQRWRNRFKIPVILVAGSAGKTTTKELIAAALSGRYADIETARKKILKTQASQNGFLGIAMTLLELRPEHEMAVIEVGIDEIGAMAQHLPLVQATHAVLTSIGPEHLEKLIDVATVAREEILSLTDTWSRGGTIIVQMDDPWIQTALAQALGSQPAGKRVIATSAKPGSAPSSPLMIRPLGPPDADSKVSIPLIDGTVVSTRIRLPGEHNLRNWVAAIATAASAGWTAQEIERGLERFEPPPGRSVVVNGRDGSQWICDYYNSQPLSVRAALDVLAERAGRAAPRSLAIACLGDMLELGPKELEFHRELSTSIISSGVDHVLLYGPRMKALKAALAAAAFSGTVAHFETHQELAASALALWQQSKSSPRHVVALIKGSRGMTMERVWKELEPHVTQPDPHPHA